jgi:uncharacterized protein YkwD
VTNTQALEIRRPLTRQLTLLLAVVTVLVGFVITPKAAHASAAEGEFAYRANSARSSARLRAYPQKADLVTVARRHAQRMASQGRIYHNPNLQTEVAGWRMVGENVGRGGTVSAIHTAFMNSTAHRANILDRDFTEVGIGIAYDAKGVIYVVQVFRLPG